MYIVVCVLIGYFVGGINPAYIIGRFKGFDIRGRGSGNAGASNAVIVMGKGIGIFTALFDIAKAYVSVKLAAVLFPQLKLAGVLCGSACILGHIFPPLMRFKGGKGLACLGGMVLALDWPVFVILLAIELVLVLVVDYICIVPITASIVYPIIFALRTGSIAGGVILALVAVIMLYKHIENIKRIINGEEAHFSYLWNKDKELERLKEKTEE
ncbi:MAG: glycerol-3-phosphate acyltransferase [Ruminococcaceae bacterium]|nr:glycerol-3-phosphate acyltransferase [Oscillospiraceae bacterium]